MFLVQMWHRGVFLGQTCPPQQHGGRLWRLLPSTVHLLQAMSCGWCQASICWSVWPGTYFMDVIKAHASTSSAIYLRIFCFWRPWVTPRGAKTGQGLGGFSTELYSQGWCAEQVALSGDQVLFDILMTFLDWRPKPTKLDTYLPICVAAASTLWSCQDFVPNELDSGWSQRWSSFYKVVDVPKHSAQLLMRPEKVANAIHAIFERLLLACCTELLQAGELRWQLDHQIPLPLPCCWVCLSSTTQSFPQHTLANRLLGKVSKMAQSSMMGKPPHALGGLLMQKMQAARAVRLRNTTCMRSLHPVVKIHFQNPGSDFPNLTVRHTLTMDESQFESHG